MSEAVLDESAYRLKARAELDLWLTRMAKGPTRLGLAARGLQRRINRLSGVIFAGFGCALLRYRP